MKTIHDKKNIIEIKSYSKKEHIPDEYYKNLNQYTPEQKPEN